MLTFGFLRARCLVDTGAATSLGDSIFFGKISNRRKLINPIKLNTLIGSSIIEDEVIVYLPNEFNSPDQTMSLKLVDLKNKPFDCIIGNNILSPLGAQIDLRHNELKIRDSTILIGENKPPFEYGDIFCLEGHDRELDEFLHDDLSSEEREQLSKFLQVNKRTFYIEGQNLTSTNSIRHKIITTSNQPIYSKIYRYPQIHEKEIERQIREMLKQGIIRPSKSPYSSPLWIVPKKMSDTGIKKWRVVIDYRKLNEVTIQDKFPIPNMESLFDKLGRSQYYTTLDLAKGFYQILMDERDIEKTAFSTPMGHFEYIRMPFGLKNAPATFQRMMNHVLSDYINKICVIYMDDILVFSVTIKEHFESLNKIFKRLNEFNLKVQLDKCKFLTKYTEFLGHIITPEGITPNPEKIKAIKNLKLPGSVKQIKSFLGLTGFYRKFIKNYSTIANPMIKYLRKNTHINMRDQEYIDSFDKLKTLLTTYPVLAYPEFDKEFVLTTDASDIAIGAVLSQKGRPISYASRTLNSAERNYHTLEKELLAIVWSVKYFRPYLYGRKFLVRTDHQPLKWLYSLKEPNSRIIRWKIMLGEFEFDVEYLKGKDNKVADFLSRIPKPNVEDEENLDIKSLFELTDSDMSTVHSANEDLNEHFLISETVVNKYRKQIRILNQKEKETEILYNKYKIIYIERNDLPNDHYLNDIFRRELNKGTVGIYSELGDSEYNIVQNKLIQLFSNDSNLKFIKCTKLAVDVENVERLLQVIENNHIETNHRGVVENFEELKFKYFYPNLVKYINKYINNCQLCAENKYDRKPFRKYFNFTETPNRPNQIVHADIFHVHKNYFLTTIDRFTKLGSAHRLSDKNMCTIKTKLDERISYLGKPETLILDNEFNNTYIKLFCSERNINAHFTTPNSHTGNSDVERLHSTLLEHIRIIKRSNENMSIEELVIRAIGYYNNSIHSTIGIKPMDFINRSNLDFSKIALQMNSRKQKAIQRLNLTREPVPNYNPDNMYVKNIQGQRHKTAKRYNKYNPIRMKRIDIAQIKRPLKVIR